LQPLDGRHSSKVVGGMAWHPGQTMLATCSDNGTAIRLWQVAAGTSRILTKSAGSIWGLAWSPDGSRLASAAQSGEITIWDAEVGVRLHAARVLRAYSIAWSRDGHTLAAGGDDDAISILATDDLHVKSRLRLSSGEANSVAFSPDSRLVVSASADATIHVWNHLTGQPITVLEGHTGRVLAVQFSPDGHFLASAASGEVRLWRCRDWQPVATLPCARRVRMSGLSFHPSQPLLAAEGGKAAADRDRRGTAAV
jgi:WD40 repeat protein